MNNIQDIKKEFKKKFPELYSSCDGREGYDTEVLEDVITFFEPYLVSKREVLEGFVEWLNNKKWYEDSPYKDVSKDDVEKYLQEDQKEVSK